MGVKRIPISAAKEIAAKYEQNQVLIVTFDKSENRTHVITYGKTFQECKEAAQGGNFVKKALGWPDNLCQDKPARQKAKERTSCAQPQTASNNGSTPSAKPDGAHA